MTTASATVKLRHSKAEAPRTGRLLALLLRLEAWLDNRASRRALYQLDGRALADIGLTEADLGRSDPTASWQSYTSQSEWR